MEEKTTIAAHGFIGRIGLGAAPRELECLMAVAAGFTSKETAKLLGVAAGSVDKRLLALTTKLGVTRRAAMVAEAMRRGLIAPVCVALVAALLVGQHQPASMTRRPTTPRRVEMRVAARRHEAAWVA